MNIWCKDLLFILLCCYADIKTSYDGHCPHNLQGNLILIMPEAVHEFVEFDNYSTLKRVK